ncbi:MAG: geranylgeranylglycerol-phosphate geranylgeranyltransferase [Bacteroidota bacterium]
MKTIGAFLQLIRLPNLLIIAATQYLMRECLIKVLLRVRSTELSGYFEVQVSEGQFFLLTLSTVLIAAAGYIINDYFDIKIDRVNKPHKVVIDRYIKRRVAMGAHIVINFLAIAIAVVVSFQLNRLVLVSIHIFSAGALWFYSTDFKNKFLVGNLVIAINAALVPLIVGLYEVPLLNERYTEEVAQFGPIFNLIAYWIIGYTVFAFVLTVAREITKDIVDIKGDKNYGCQTIPIVLGIKPTKYSILLIYALFAAGVAYVQQTYLPDRATLFFCLFILGGLTGWASLVIIKAKTKPQFALASSINKWIMIAGLSYALAIGYFLLNGPVL